VVIVAIINGVTGGGLVSSLRNAPSAPPTSTIIFRSQGFKSGDFFSNIKKKYYSPLDF
jgi:hypothetical protein